jgi:polynucleotide 5'-kinase involved in rRNA processing
MRARSFLNVSSNTFQAVYLSPKESLTSDGTDDLRSSRARTPPCLIGTARTIRVEAEKTLVIVGPASFELAEGEASVLGAPLNSVRHIVSAGKQTPVEIRSRSSFRISLGEQACVEELDGSTIPLSWREAGSALVELGEGIAAVIGGADTGKTTLCAFLSNYLIAEKRQVAVVDADIGQSDLGPPTTMAAGEVKASVTNLSQIETSERLFIGLTSPGQAKCKVIRGTKRLVGYHARPGKITIVNTDGWVSGTEAVLYKLQMLDGLQPDITVGIGGSEISPILQVGNRTTLLVASPDTIKERTRIDRKELRSLGYRRYLTGASLKTFHVDGLNVRSCLTLNNLDLARVSRAQAGNLKDAIVGLLDADDLLQEIGILKDAVPSARILRIWSRILNAPSKIEVGDVKLSNDGRELGYLGQ